MRYRLPFAIAGLYPSAKTTARLRAVSLNRDFGSCRTELGFRAKPVHTLDLCWFQRFSG